MNQQDKERLRELASDLMRHGDTAVPYTIHNGILALLEENERLAALIRLTKWPASAQDVRAFFRNNCESEQWAIDEHTASEDDRYQLTAHDFLSAVDWWTGFLGRDIDAAMQHKGD